MTTAVEQNEQIKLPPPPHRRCKSDNVLFEDAIEASIQEIESPKPLQYTVSNPLKVKAIKLYTVRPCQVKDTETIVQIMRDAWPDEPEWRNPQFWSKEFIKPSSQRYGYVIEQDDVVGFAMYRWSAPIPDHRKSQRNAFEWFYRDFQTETFAWNDGFSSKSAVTPNGYNVYYNNQNLKENWNRLRTHFVHITDVAIHPHHRGKGLGTQLMQSVIYSFPSGTRFALEVKCSNGGGIKCYQKCGFTTQRKMPHYYARNEHGIKMVLISDYRDSDVAAFVEETQLKRIDAEKEQLMDKLNALQVDVGNEETKKRAAPRAKDDDQDHELKVEDEDSLQSLQIPDILTTEPSLSSLAEFAATSSTVPHAPPPSPTALQMDPTMSDLMFNPLHHDRKSVEVIGDALRELCGDHWNAYLQNFKDQGIGDDDLIGISDAKLRVLIPKIGPRARFRKWVFEMIDMR